MPEPTPSLRRIGLIGGEGSGKTTLATALASALPACSIDEGLRAFVDREGRTPRRSEQQALMVEQAAREEAVAAACPHPWLVADPAPLMTAVYSLLYFDDDSLLAAAVGHAAGYDLVIWCRPDFPWSPDGIQRDGSGARAEADSIIGHLVAEELGPRGIRVLEARGVVDDRVAAVRRAWQRRPPTSPT
jgi:nicotinamide riboside kinase